MKVTDVVVISMLMFLCFLVAWLVGHVRVLIKETRELTRVFCQLRATFEDEIAASGGFSSHEN